MPLGLPHGSTVVESYDPEWPVLFQHERHLIVAAIGHIVAGVHHVGSTSIPGMPAKPLLDIAVLLHDFDDGERCITPLEKIGYVHVGFLDDIPGDRIFGKCDDPQEGYSDFDEKDEIAGGRGPKGRTHMLHVYTLDSPIRQNHFHFRDYLIAHPETAAEYGRLKVSLADKHPNDRKSYSAGKRSFITEVLAKAAEEFE